MDYHIARNNQQLGVFPETEIRAGLAAGTFNASDLVWCEGMSAWKSAAEVFGEAGKVPPPVAAPVAPAQVPPPAARPPKPNNYLVWAILATVLCCIPFGIVSIVYASQVDSKYVTADYAGAEESARLAKVWFWVAAIAGGLPLVGAAVFFGGSMLLGFLGAMAGH